MGHVNQYEKAKYTKEYNGSTGARQAWDEQVKADDVNSRIARSRKRKNIATFLAAAVAVAGIVSVSHNLNSLAPDGTVRGTQIVPKPKAAPVQDSTGSASSNDPNKDFSGFAVRVCDKPAALAMETVVKCFGIPAGEKVVVTTAPQAEGQYRITKYDKDSKEFLWTGFVSQKSYLPKDHRQITADERQRTIQRPLVMPGAQIKVAITVASATFYPYVSNKAPSELSAQIENRKVAMSHDQVPVKKETAIELYGCDGFIGLCDAGIRTPGGALYGTIKQQDVKYPRDGYYGEITGPQPATGTRPVTGARPTPRL